MSMPGLVQDTGCQLVPQTLTLLAAYILRRYWPPTSNKAFVI